MVYICLNLTNKFFRQFNARGREFSEYKIKLGAFKAPARLLPWPKKLAVASLPDRAWKKV